MCGRVKRCGKDFDTGEQLPFGGLYIYFHSVEGVLGTVKK